MRKDAPSLAREKSGAILQVFLDSFDDAVLIAEKRVGYGPPGYSAAKQRR
jgi:hypothetical protein